MSKFVKEGDSKRRCYRLTIWKTDKQLSLPEGAKYLIYQKEKCPDTGKLHFQTFVYYKNAVRLETVREHFPPKSWILTCERSMESNINYASKEESRIDGPWELGVRPSQGNRIDIKDVIDKIEDGMDENQLLEVVPDAFVKYHKFFREKIEKKWISKNRIRDIKVVVLWGEAGAGKTPKAIEDLIKITGEYPFIMKHLKWNKEWWDGYDGERGAVIDELEPGQVDYVRLKHLLEGYTEQLPYKGGHRYSRIEYLYITSNYHPKDWYFWTDKVTPEPLMKRIFHIHKMARPMDRKPLKWNDSENDPLSRLV